MKLLEFKRENNIINEKTLNKKKAIISIIVIVIAIITIVLCGMYVTNTKFRETVDEYILRKSVTENSLNSIEFEAKSKPNIYAYDNSIVVLEKNTLTRYNSSGKQENSLNIEISEPVFCSSGKYLMIAEKGKQKVYLIHNNSIIWEKDIEGTVAKISVNKNGYTSIIVTGTTYKSVIEVYDKTGKELFKTYLSSTIAVDSSISDDNKYMSFAEINTSGTLIKSIVKTVSMEKAKTSPSESIIDTYEGKINDIIINIQYNDKDRLVCLYTTGVHVFRQGKEEILYEIDNNENKATYVDIELNGYAYKIVEKSSGFKANSTLNIYNTSNKKENIYTFNGVAKSLYSNEGVIAINLGSEIHFVGTNGWLLKKYIASQEVKEIVVADGIAAILLRNKLEFIQL